MHKAWSGWTLAARLMLEARIFKALMTQLDSLLEMSALTDTSTDKPSFGWRQVVVQTPHL